jgi:hypothetical protein
MWINSTGTHLEMTGIKRWPQAIEVAIQSFLVGRDTPHGQDAGI